ncbi:MAG: DDE-type integrase/transposase/recombinase, partial [Pseudonocardiales bacterium]|nr:DDE-type integrase/transposase/recombinase [Pseudonocardiales bacterium]
DRGRWIYPYRAIAQFGQVIDVLASEKRDLPATRRFFAGTLEHHPLSTEVTTDRAPVYPQVLDEHPPPVTSWSATQTILPRGRGGTCVRRWCGCPSDIASLSPTTAIRP